MEINDNKQLILLFSYMCCLCGANFVEYSAFYYSFDEITFEYDFLE